jgi:hypothetical protein
MHQYHIMPFGVEELFGLIKAGMEYEVMIGGA